MRDPRDIFKNWPYSNWFSGSRFCMKAGRWFGVSWFKGFITRLKVVHLGGFLKYFSKCISKCFSTWVFNFPDVQGYAMKCYDKNSEKPQPAITYSKLTIETLEQGIKYVQR